MLRKASLDSVKASPGDDLGARALARLAQWQERHGSQRKVSGSSLSLHPDAACGGPQGDGPDSAARNQQPRGAWANGSAFRALPGATLEPGGVSLENRGRKPLWPEAAVA